MLATKEDFKSRQTEDHSGTIAEALFIANLLFVGIFYLLLWGLYFLAYKNASPVSKSHIKQTLIASSISTLIVILLNLFILLTSGYASATALIVAEVYLMLIVPLFMIVGILGFTKAVQGLDFSFPLISKFITKPLTESAPNTD
jgi:cytochrome bd-type quinol oxidase subunit 2